MTREEALQAQRKLWSVTGGWVTFPPDGICYSCGGDIVQFYLGLNSPRIHTEMVTGCPRCNRSLVS